MRPLRARLSPPLLFLLLSLLSVPAAPAATLYVDDLNDGQFGDGSPGNPYRHVQSAIDHAQSGDTVFIRNGRHYATPVNFIDPTCGNCDAASFRQNIPATRGFLVIGKTVFLKGESRTGTILETRAGYGVLFESAGTSRIENLTITGGIRDRDGRATNGAVVARATALTVRFADIVYNSNRYTGTPDPIVGISGIVGREGAVIEAHDLLIAHSSWDGIALYRGDPAVPNSGARATIRHLNITHGRGVGIGVAWDARATIYGVSVSNFWKGVGSFGSAVVSLKSSIVRDHLMWGVIAAGTSSLTAVNNVVTRVGTVGMAQWDPTATVDFTNNIVYDNGRDPNGTVGPRAGVMLTDFSRVAFLYNDLYGNQLQNVCAGLACSPLPFLIGINGNISANPWFVSAANNNFALVCGSSAINAGTPSLIDIDGTRSDMGAYGGPVSPHLPPACGPDLTPTPITFTPASPRAGQTVTFDSAVRNQMSTATGVFNVRWLIDGVQVGLGSHAGVPGHTTVGNGNSALLWTATPGTHTVTFALDVSGHVVEANEGNNSTSVTIHVAP